MLALAGLPAASAAQEAAERGTGAVLRGLDKISGTVEDVTLVNGARVTLGRLEISLRECRYPEGDPSGDAWAYVVIREDGKAEPVFAGWMTAASPALNALDHARYDVWVLRCTTS
ncbi:DUF2155 domain-containing protein [Rhodosalinus sp. FB01]|uniref:DUF2155 domain-containing protein n=1 Tax=Rhodosalinus sp. FB01 TaxID=3239194 RepID=UPI0035250138